jgi:hypothetical protein
MKVLRTLVAFCAAAIVASFCGAVFHSQMVLARLAALGAEITPALRVTSTLDDMVGLIPAYPVVISIGLAVGFAVAFGVKRILKPLAPVAYPLAGAAAVALALYLMSQQFYTTTPIAGARGTIGFLLQCLAGGLGGVVFAVLRPR